MEYLNLLEKRNKLTKDEQYMAMALELAVRAEGNTSPNPMVGCVIVKNDIVVASGYHHRCGELHAERNALQNASSDVSGATLYVTLEPCCHYGKTPPCTEAIIENKIKRVVVGATDNNPLVDNKGIRILREHGIEVIVGVLEEECRRVNEVFFYYITNKLPYIVMKYAMTLDGKIAAYSGDSKWITSNKSREHVHKLRARYSAIMVGINTVLIDNPMLNCRIRDNANPIRIILDTHLRTPADSNIMLTAKDIETIIVTVDSNDDELKSKEEKLRCLGADVLKVSASKCSGCVDLYELMRVLGKRGIDSILVEGGATLHGQLLSDNMINKVYSYIAPKIIGGERAKGPIGGSGIEYMKDACVLYESYCKKLGDDILIYGYPKICESR